MTATVELPKGCREACPGCRYRRYSIERSRSRKQTHVETELHRWADRIEALVEPASDRRLGYRDKVCLNARHSSAGGWRFGLMDRDELIPIPDCPVHTERVNGVTSVLRQHLPDADRFPLAYVLAAGAQWTLVLKSRHEPHLDWLEEAAPALARLGVEGLWVHLNPSAGKQMFTKRGWSLVWGRATSSGEGDLIHGPTAFQQLLPELHAESLERAQEFLAPRPGSLVLDLYCGLGASLRRWTQAGARGVGVELSGEAVDCARLNAPRATLLRGDCLARTPQLDDHLDAFEGRRLLYCNPARDGLGEALITWITERMAPERIAYLACSMGSLRRDLEQLVEAGYAVERVHPYDFFPQTQHVEALGLLVRG